MNMWTLHFIHIFIIINIMHHYLLWEHMNINKKIYEFIYVLNLE